MVWVAMRPLRPSFETPACGGHPQDEAATCGSLTLRSEPKAERLEAWARVSCYSRRSQPLPMTGRRMPRHIVCLTFDFDTQSGFIARGMTTPTPLSRGEFGAHRVAARILQFLKERGIKATWFTPGFTIESWPKESAAVVEGGHEIGHHSWAHIPNANQTRDEEEADLVRANENIRKLTGRTARGYRSPSWDLSAHTIDLLLKHGFLYDSSLMGADYIPVSRAARRQGRARQALRIRRGDVADRNADLVVARRLSAFRVHPHAADGRCPACSRRAR